MAVVAMILPIQSPGFGACETTETGPWLCRPIGLFSIDLAAIGATDEARLLQTLRQEGLGDMATLLAEDLDVSAQAIELSDALLPPYVPTHAGFKFCVAAPVSTAAAGSRIQHSDGPAPFPQSTPDYTSYLCLCRGARIDTSGAGVAVTLPGMAEVVGSVLDPESWDASQLQENGTISDGVLELLDEVGRRERRSESPTQIRDAVKKKVREAYPGAGWYRRPLPGGAWLWALLDLRFESGMEATIRTVLPVLLVGDAHGRISGARIAEFADGSKSWYYAVSRDPLQRVTELRVLVRSAFQEAVAYEGFLLCRPIPAKTSGAGQ